MSTNASIALDAISRLEKIRYNIVQRCYVKSNTYYKYYGAVGITMYKKWIDNPTNFIRWCLANGWEAGLVVGRKRHDLPYSPWNVEFTTQEECLAKRNSTPNRDVGFRGRTYKLPLNITKQITQAGTVRYSVLFNRDGKRYYVGNYNNVEQAVRARDRAIKAYERNMA